MSSPHSYTSKQVFDEHAAFIWRTLRYLGVPEADVPDVCQEVFITVHRKIGEFEGRSALRTWLYRICQRAASDQRKRAYVRREIVSDDPSSGQASQDLDGVGQLEARNALKYALDQLEDGKREVFVLYEIEGLTMKEIADILECPLQTAYSRLHAARRQLEELVEEKGKVG